MNEPEVHNIENGSSVMIVIKLEFRLVQVGDNTASGCLGAR